MIFSFTGGNKISTDLFTKIFVDEIDEIAYFGNKIIIVFNCLEVDFHDNIICLDKYGNEKWRIQDYGEFFKNTDKYENMMKNCLNDRYTGMTPYKDYLYVVSWNGARLHVDYETGKIIELGEYFGAKN